MGGTEGHDGYFRPGSAALAGLVDVVTRDPDPAS
jgi:hypothetical protein